MGRGPNCARFYHAIAVRCPVIEPRRCRGGVGVGPCRRLTAGSRPALCTPSVPSVKGSVGATHRQIIQRTPCRAVADARADAARPGPAHGTLYAAAGAPLTRSAASPADFDARPCSSCQPCRATPRPPQDPRAIAVCLTGTARARRPSQLAAVTVRGLGCTLRRPRAGQVFAAHPKAGLSPALLTSQCFGSMIDMLHFTGGFARAAPLKPTDVLASREVKPR